MRGAIQDEVRTGIVTVLFLSLVCASAVAQGHGPPTWSSIGGHSLAPPASVTSFSGGQHLSGPLPSVTSIPNYGYHYRAYAPSNGYRNGRGGSRYGYGYGYGGYTMPYYIPLDSYGYDYVGGPDVYSGPPVAPEQTLHIIVEQPPATRYNSDPEEQWQAATPPARTLSQPSSPGVEAKPNEPTVLVFRDGHKQEVSNYAIMGQTVYVFDKRTRKIALADLDVAATVKANDDRGISFSVPPQKSAPKKAQELQPKSAPDQPSQPAPSVV